MQMWFTYIDWVHMPSHKVGIIKAFEIAVPRHGDNYESWNGL